MGGFGSGSWDRWNTKALTTSCLSLEARRLHKDGLLQSGAVYECSWNSGPDGPKASIGIRVCRDQLILRYRHGDNDGVRQDITETVSLTWTPCNYGGQRPWFRCPGVSDGARCDRRVAKLYLGGRYFVCRHCCRLAYHSQSVAIADRPMRRAQDIRLRLGGSANLLAPFPWKPKGMHWQTYWRLRHKAQKAEAVAWGILSDRIDRMKTTRDSG